MEATGLAWPTFVSISLNVIHDANANGVYDGGDSSVWSAGATLYANGSLSTSGAWTNSDFIASPLTGVAKLVNPVQTSTYANTVTNVYLLDVTYNSQATGNAVMGRVAMEFEV